jgi:hypothetical protein
VLSFHDSVLGSFLAKRFSQRFFFHNACNVRDYQYIQKYSGTMHNEKFVALATLVVGELLSGEDV